MDSTENDAEGNAKQVPVPKGYTASQIDGETTVSGGFVIYEGNIDWSKIIIESTESEETNTTQTESEETEVEETGTDDNTEEPALEEESTTVETEENNDESTTEDGSTTDNSSTTEDGSITDNSATTENDSTIDNNLETDTASITDNNVTTANETADETAIDDEIEEQEDSAEDEEADEEPTAEEQTRANIFELQSTVNQYVWVPVEDITEIYGVDSQGKIWGKLYNFSRSGRSNLYWTETNGIMAVTSQTGYREPDVLQNLKNYDNELDLQSYMDGKTRYEFLEEMQQNYYVMLKSVKEYGGFYIGRYETGGLSGTAVVQKMNTDIASQTWYSMYNKCKQLNGSNDNVKTSMIWGSLWDATLEWLVDSGATNSSGTQLTYSLVGSNSTTWGNYKDATFEYIPSGGDNGTKLRNAFASITTSTNKGSITVSDLEAGVNVSIYQLTTVNYDYTSDQPEAVPYTWVSNVKTWIESSDDYSSYADPEVFYEDVTSNSSEAKAFYSDLAAAIKGSQITLDATATQTTTGTASYPVTEAKLQSTATFTDCEMGTYLVLIENGYRVYTPSVVNLTPEYNTTDKEWVLASNVDVEVKSTTPQITKTVTDTTSTKDNYNVTDEITYTIIADIPNYEEGSLAKNYYISDTLNDGLNLVSDSIEVYGVKGSVEEKLTSGYTQGTTRPNNLGDATFSLEFTYSDISSYEKIKVVYKATLDKSDKTVIGSEGNKNTAYLDYSNNPYDATSYQTQASSENTVYTYGIEISKIDKTSKVALTGAEFTLSKSNDNLYFVKTADGIYYQANSTDTGATTNLVVDGNGKLYLYGLDEGTYSLTETKAPEGYNISVTASTITITDSNLDGALDDEDGTTGIYKLTVTNTQGFTLPITGGIGTTIFAAAGIE